ncbi:MAG TPA: gallate dioxygenase, partial [Ilumatobacteraceae bacterium]|nr:gallate dioxygenase [Ilumatobacteraceae bacterium]
MAVMARIVAGIGASHSPQVGFAKDTQSPDSTVWGPIFAMFEPVAQWLDDVDPDVIVHIYNDHITSFFFDHYSPFVLGVDDQYVVADEGGGPRDHPPVKGHAALARHIGASLMADEFDISFFRNKPIDHGMFSPLSMMTDRGTRWSGAVIPLQVGVLQFPIPTARRCYDLGRGLARAIESYDEDLSVAVVATGGLSHQVHGERAGFNNPEWDDRFLDLLESQPESLTALTHAEYAELGGAEGTEVIMWLIMRGALSSNVRVLHRATYHPSMTNLATVIYENEHTPGDEEVAAQRQLVDAQLAGIEELPGTYPFTLETAARAYQLNAFLHDLTKPPVRERFLTDAASVYDEFGLSTEDRRLLEARDWIGLIRAGAIFFGLEK